MRELVLAVLTAALSFVLVGFVLTYEPGRSVSPCADPPPCKTPHVVEEADAPTMAMGRE